MPINSLYRPLHEITSFPKKKVRMADLEEPVYIGVEQLVKNRGGVVFTADTASYDSGVEFLPGDVLIGNIRPYLKKIWLADRRGCASGDVVVVRVKEEYRSIIEPSFLYLALSTDAFFDYDTANTTGAKMPRGQRNVISKYEVPCPDKDEQKRIVEEITLLSDIIVRKRQQISDLNALSRSIFIEMFGDPLTNPKGWPVVNLDSFAESKIGLTYKPENVCDEGTIVLRSSNIQDSEIDLKDIVRVDCSLNDSQHIHNGDILMCSRNGSLKLVGKVARIGNLPEKMTFGAFMTAIRSDYNAYLFEFFKLPAFRMQLGLAKTSTINQITVKMLNNTKVMKPSQPLLLSFEKKVALIDKKKSTMKQSLKDCEYLFHSRMSSYFD